MRQLILLRHAQSVWNQENRFTGWTDVSLSAKGEEEARQAAGKISAAGYRPGYCFTSYLKRAVKTLCLVLEEMDLMWVPVHKTWRLNERHYGALQGQDKTQAALRYGQNQVQTWRRGYKSVPPALEQDDPQNPALDARYAGLAARPLAESLEHTVQRVLPCWQKEIIPALDAWPCVLVCAHGNSLRGLIMHLLSLSEEKITGFEVPTGLPLIYKLDQDNAVQESLLLD